MTTVTNPVTSSAGRGPAPVNTEGDQACTLDIGREANALALSPDSRRVAVALQDHTVQIWDIEMQVPVHVLRGHKYWVNAVSWSLDGVHLASGSADKTIKVWHAVEGKCEATLQGHLLSVAAVSFSEDAMRLASGSWDKTVCIWDVELSKALIALSGHADWVHAVAWAPGGRQIASASSDHTVRVWNAITGVVEQVLVGHLQTVSSLSYAKNGVHLASGSLDRTVRVWNLQEGSLAAKLQQDSDEGSVHSVAFANDSERLIVGSGDRSVKVWNVSTGEHEFDLNGHEESVRDVAITADGRRIFSCSHDTTVRVWRMPVKRRTVLPQSPTASGFYSATVQNCAGSRGPGSIPPCQSSTAVSFKELHDRLRATEETNERLRRELSEAQLELEENSWKLRKHTSSRDEQERELHNYREVISSLTAEKEKLERSFELMRKELRQIPSCPAGKSDVALNQPEQQTPLRPGVFVEPLQSTRPPPRIGRPVGSPGREDGAGIQQHQHAPFVRQMAGCQNQLFGQGRPHHAGTAVSSMPGIPAGMNARGRVNGI